MTNTELYQDVLMFKNFIEEITLIMPVKINSDPYQILSDVFELKKYPGFTYVEHKQGNLTLETSDKVLTFFSTNTHIMAKISKALLSTQESSQSKDICINLEEPLVWIMEAFGELNQHYINYNAGNGNLDKTLFHTSKLISQSYLALVMFKIACAQLKEIVSNK